MDRIIYGLMDTRTDEIRYIGKSSSGLTRPRTHTSDSALKRDKTYKGNWLRSMLEAGYMPEIIVLEIVATDDDIDKREIHWIAYGWSEYWPLTNLTPGGEGWPNGKPQSEEFCRLLSLRATGNQYALGNTHSDEWKAAMSERMKGNKHAAGVVLSPERRAAIAAVHMGNQYNVGKKHTAEWKQAASERMMGKQLGLGRVPTQEQRDKQRVSCLAAWDAKTAEEKAAHAAKISATKIANGDQGNIENLRKGHAPEVRARAVAKSADMRRGVALSQEQRDAISEGNKRAYAEGRRVAPTALPPGKWSHKFEACIECHATKYRHKCNGHCTSCWERLFRTPKRTAARQAKIAAEQAADSTKTG